MGRIHRYGQQKEVYIFNLVAQDTREGKVLNKLFAKLKEIRRALGSDKVFDCLGEVLCDRNLSQLLLEAAANARNIDEILQEIEITVDEEYIARVKENLGESLATRFIDYTRIKEMAEQAREYRLIPEYTEGFFKKAFFRAGGKSRELKSEYLAIDSIPYELRRIAAQDNFKKSYGSLLRKYSRVTFDKDVAFRNPDVEFISFGHPLFEAVMKWIEGNFFPCLFAGATFIDPNGRLDGHILFYEGEIKDGTGDAAGKRLFSFYVRGPETKPISPVVIWDLEESKDIPGDGIDLEALKNQTSQAAISGLEEYKGEIFKERLRQTRIKGKYGLKSLEHLILKLDGDLISLYARRDQGENVALAVRNKEGRKSEYERALSELKGQIEKEKSLTMSMPRFLGIIRVKAKETFQRDQQRDEEIERIGMHLAIAHEKKCHRIPEDVSSENLGFDIRSRDQSGRLRYIEVKARARIGDVALTQNEWFKAQRFKDDYHLYVVLHAATQPELLIISNPAEKLQPEEKIELVRYVIPLQEIREKGEVSDK